MESEEMLKVTSVGILSRSFKRGSPEAIREGKARVMMENIVERAENKLKNAMQISDTEAQLLTDEELHEIAMQSDCDNRRDTPHCDFNYRYRYIDGTCNNLYDPLRGAAGVPLRRLIPAAYEDNIQRPRGRNYNCLYNPFVPSARSVSLKIVSSDLGGDEWGHTHMLMQWGQFVDHDIDRSPQMKGQCASCIPTQECEPICIPPGDPTYGGGQGTTADGRCLSFVRSVAVCDGQYSVRNQINEITSYLDGSQVYGSKDAVYNAVRDFYNNGRMKVQYNNMLPYDYDDKMACPKKLCYLAGDRRANENIGLTSLHTLFVREHNRIAASLHSLNQNWNDETIFQQTRKIIGAIIQKITYKDYLPLILGEDTLSIVGLGPYSGYNSHTDATILNGFSTAAYRFGHSQVQKSYRLYYSDSYQYGTSDEKSLVDAFFNPHLTSTKIDAILRGLITERSAKLDEFMNTILTNRLFETGGGGYGGSGGSKGLDLASLNIQRSRDHGLPVYGEWVRACAAAFPGLEQGEIANYNTRVKLTQLYGSINNADLFVGGLAERRVPNGLVGPTFACIIGLTFAHLRDGDRFWYENSSVFTAEQRNEIEKVTLASVICDNTNINVIQQDVFKANQARVSCNTLPRMSLAPW